LIVLSLIVSDPTAVRLFNYLLYLPVFTAAFFFGRRQVLLWIAAAWLTGLVIFLVSQSKDADALYSAEALFGHVLSAVFAFIVGHTTTIKRNLNSEIKRRKTAEQHEEEIRRRYQNLIDKQGEGIGIVNTDEVFLFANPAAEEIFGLAAGGLLGRDLREFLSDDAYKTVLKETGKRKQKDKSSYELPIRRSDGEERMLLVTATPQEDEDGNVIGSFGIFRDITDIKKAQDQLEEARTAAEEANKMKSRFLSTMSHEIRTPISGIIGMTELLLNESMEEDDLSRLKLIKTAADHLLYLINDILDLSSIEAGKMEIKYGKFDLYSLLSELRELFTHAVQGKKLEFRYEIPHTIPPFLIGDPLRIRQVLLNLLSNAVKFTDEGFIALRLPPPRLEQNSILLRFEISDSGIGIPLEKRELLFTSFNRLENTYNTSRPGTGLGLAISRSLARKMGGELLLAHSGKEGSTFVFELPLKRAETAVSTQDHASAAGKFVTQMQKEGQHSPAPAADTEKTEMKGRILLAEDNEINRIVISRLLKKAGYTVIQAAHGREALEHIAEKPVDLILMDIQMPEIDGFEASRIIRENKDAIWDGNVPIIALTAYTSEDEVKKSLEAGMNDYITKPAEKEKLLRIIEKWKQRNE
jgi:hypothetical protein